MPRQRKLSHHHFIHTAALGHKPNRSASVQFSSRKEVRLKGRERERERDRNEER